MNLTFLPMFVLNLPYSAAVRALETLRAARKAWPIRTVQNRQGHKDACGTQPLPVFLRPFRLGDISGAGEANKKAFDYLCCCLELAAIWVVKRFL